MVKRLLKTKNQSEQNKLEYNLRYSSPNKSSQ